MGEIYFSNCSFPLDIAALHCFTLLALLYWVFSKQDFVPACKFQPRTVSRILVLSSLSNPQCYMCTHTHTLLYSFILSLSLSQLWLIIPTSGHFPKSLRKTCYCRSGFIPAFFLCSKKLLLDNPFHHTSTEPSVPVFHDTNSYFFIWCSNSNFCCKTLQLYYFSQLAMLPFLTLSRLQYLKKILMSSRLFSLLPWHFYTYQSLNWHIQTDNVLWVLAAKTKSHQPH